MLSVDGKLGVSIECMDIREVYGRLDVQVKPIEGAGSMWVSENRIAWSK